MNTHVGVNDGLVSNDSDSEIRESSAQGAELDLHVWTCSWSERQVRKRDLFKGPLSRGQLSSRKLTDPSTSECRIPAYVAKNQLMCFRQKKQRVRLVHV